MIYINDALRGQLAERLTALESSASLILIMSPEETETITDFYEKIDLNLKEITRKEINRRASGILSITLVIHVRQDSPLHLNSADIQELLKLSITPRENFREPLFVKPIQVLFGDLNNDAFLDLLKPDATRSPGVLTAASSALFSEQPRRGSPSTTAVAQNQP